MGPTAAGKTAIAITLSQRLQAQIISVDSAMVYRRMDIGSGKPTTEQLSRAPHRLINIKEPYETYSAAEFIKDAKREIADIVAMGDIPLLVGGTGLYFRALEEGLSALPPSDIATREAITARANRQGWFSLHHELRKIDAKRAAQIHPHDAQRIQRALEIHALTGMAPSQLQDKWKSGLDNPILKIVISPAERSTLHHVIASRFDTMLQRGLIDEVIGLRADPRITADISSMRAVGYRQVWHYLEGHYSLRELRTKGVVATRQLARRQLTWLRGLTSVRWVDPMGAGVMERIVQLIQNHRLAN